MAENGSYSCDRCSYRCNIQLEVIKHGFNTHSSEPLFRLKCGIQGCLHIFSSGSSFSSYKTHASRKHPNWQSYLSPTFSVRSTIDQDTEPPAFISEEDEEDDCMDTFSEAEDIQSVPQEVAPKVHAALFLLAFKEKYNISQGAINYAVGSITTIVEKICSNVQQSVTTTLRENNFTDDISSSFGFEEPFFGLETEYRQSLYYRTEFGLIVSMHACINFLITFNINAGACFSHSWVFVQI